MAEKYLSEGDIRRLLECSRCKRTPSGPPVYMCKTGHHECSNCYTKFSENTLLDESDLFTDTESDSETRKHVCAICKDEVTITRNLLAESILIHLESLKRAEKNNYLPQLKVNFQETKVQANYVDCCYNIYGPPCPRFDPLGISLPGYDPQMYPRYPVTFPTFNFGMDSVYGVPETTPALEYVNPSVYYPEDESVAYYPSGNRKEANNKRSKSNFSNQMSTVSLNGESSKRPIRCPTHMCGRNIAVAALSSHFCFDHPEVPAIHVDFDITSHLFIDPEMIPFNYGRCVAILLIPNKCQASSSVSHPNIISSTKIKNSLPLVVMASKLDCSTSSQPAIGGIHEQSESDSLNHGDYQSRGGKSRLLVIWLAGVDMNASMYTTIQVTEKQLNIRSVIYTGPIMSLRASQNTNKVYEQGDCLVIHSGILDNIVGDKGGFDLHVVVH